VFFQLINSQNGIILGRKIVESVTTYSTLLLTVKIVAFTRVNLELSVVKFMLVEIFLEPPIPIVQQTWNGLSGKVTHPATVIINSLLPAEREYWSHTLASQPSLLESVHFCVLWIYLKNNNFFCCFKLILNTLKNNATIILNRCVYIIY